MLKESWKHQKWFLIITSVDQWEIFRARKLSKHFANTKAAVKWALESAVGLSAVESISARWLSRLCLGLKSIGNYPADVKTP